MNFNRDFLNFAYKNRVARKGNGYKAGFIRETTDFFHRINPFIVRIRRGPLAQNFFMQNIIL